MTWFANLPVQRKLGWAMLVTTTVALMLACAIFLAVEYRGYRRDIEHTVSTLSRLMADNASAAIAFDDRATAAQFLDALRAEPQISSAAFYDNNGRLFASFLADPRDAVPALGEGGPAGISFAEPGYVVGVQPVEERGRRLGTLYVKASMSQIYGRMQTYVWVVAGVLAAAFALASLVALRLKQAIAAPILELANTAKAVSSGQDYSLRARQFGGDELGKLTATFNAMLERTQSAVSALRESEWSYRQLVRALPTAAYMCDAEGRITIYNDAAASLWGRAPEIGREFWCGSYRIYRPDGTPMKLDECPMAVSLREGRAVRNEEILIERPDGTRRNVLPHPQPILDTTGAIVGIVNMLVDITEQKHASEAIRRLAAIVEFSEDAIIGKDLDGNIVSWNRGAEELYGYTAEEIIGRPATVLAPPEKHDEEPGILSRIRNGERIEQYETVRVRKDGTRIDVSLAVSPIKDTEGRVVGASKIARDITARKRAEEAVREREAQLRLVTDNAPVLLIRIDRDHRYAFVNRAYADRNGVRPRDLVGKHIVDVVGPKAYEKFRSELDAALSGERVEFEVMIPYLHIGSRWVHIIYVPERNASGEVVGVLGVITDTGARKEAEIELKRARDEALAASRAKDDFLAALSHELRTPLNPVLLLASDAAVNKALPEEVRADFELIRKNVNLEARLIDDLLDLTRISRGKLRLDERLCDLEAIVRDAVENVQGDLLEKRQEMKLECDVDGAPVWGDSVRLQQVFWNVLKNSVKFTPEGGRIEVGIRKSPAGDRATVTIADTGIGMTPEEIERVFQAFSQGDHAANGTATHKFGGLGLGLAISKMLVELHGGQIQAASAGRDRGSTFEIDMPLARKAAAAVQKTKPKARGAKAVGAAKSPAPEASHGSRPPMRRERILLVEDHPATRQTLHHLLTNREYDVASAESAGEAVRLAAAREFDLLISDVGLPDRNGYELMAELRAANPRLSGIALSGYGMEEDLARSRAAGFALHLVKPVTISALEEAIAQLHNMAAIPRPAEASSA